MLIVLKYTSFTLQPCTVKDSKLLYFLMLARIWRTKTK